MSKLEKVRALISRAVHPTTPEAEARSCAWIAVQLIEKEGGLEKFSNEDRLERRMLALERKYETSMKRIMRQVDAAKVALAAVRKERALAQQERNLLRHKLLELRTIIEDDPWLLLED